MIVVRLVTGSDMTPISVLRLYSRYFPDEIPLPREVTDRIAQSFAHIPGLGTETDGRMATTMSRRASVKSMSPGSSSPVIPLPGSTLGLGNGTGTGTGMLHRHSSRGSTLGSGSRMTMTMGMGIESLADARLRRTKAALMT